MRAESDAAAAYAGVDTHKDEAQVTTGSRILFITPTLKGLLDDLCALAHRSCYVASNPMCRTDVF